jgi:hypothetical protein
MNGGSNMLNFSPKHAEPGASLAFVSLPGVIHNYE